MEALDQSGQGLGVEATALVTSDLGDYELEIDHEGLVRITAQGLFLDEAVGERRDFEIELTGLAVLSPDVEVPAYLNLLTDLTTPRTLDLLATGVTFEEARAQTEAELVAALHVGFGGAPEDAAVDLDPYGAGYAQSYLFAVSGVIAQTADDIQQLGEGDLGTLMERIRDDFSEDGQIAPELDSQIHLSESRLDPELAIVSLQATMDLRGDSRPVPDPHPVLDSDQDGISNAEDNCRYAANDDQTDSEGRGWGDACDDRLLAIAATDKWSCGVLASDGSLSCWDVMARGLGGTAPHPLVYPGAVGWPWGEDAGLTGTYVDVAMAGPNVCAVETGGEIACWVKEEGLFAMPGAFERVEVGAKLVCGLSEGGIAECGPPDSPPTVVDAGPFLDLAIVDGDKVIVLDDYGELSWLDAGAGEGDYALPSGTWSNVEAGGIAGGWGCALSAVDGSVSCFGIGTLVDGAPSGTGYTELTVGTDIACVGKSMEAPTCWREEATCPTVQEAPPGLAALTTEDCYICGINDEGFGACWPRRWYQESQPK